MPRCSHCGRRFLNLDQETCPACSRPARRRAADDDAEPSERPSDGVDGDAAPGPMRPVARFANAAEAGYFANELELTERIPTRLSIEEDFDAITGRWGTRYLLLAPEDRAATAALALQKLVEHTDGDEFVAESDVAGLPRRQATDGAVHWVPIVLTLAAGSVVLWGVRKFNDRPKVNLPHAPAGRQHVELWESLAAPHGPWSLDNDEARGTRQLWVDPQRNLAVIREDADGDGAFERELHLRPVPARR